MLTFTTLYTPATHCTSNMAAAKTIVDRILPYCHPLCTCVQNRFLSTGL